MKKILHFISGPYLPMSQNWIYWQIVNLEGYEPVVYCYRTENLDLFSLNTVRSLEVKYHCNFLSVIIDKLIRRLPVLFLFALLRDKPDIIHAHFGNSGFRALILKKFSNLPLVTTFYGFDLSCLPEKSPRWKSRFLKLFRQGDFFVVEGACMRRRLIALGCPEGKILIHRIGVDLDKIKFLPRKIGEDRQIKILISARFCEKKGIPFALKAFALVRKENLGVNLMLTIIGDANKNSSSDCYEKRKIIGLVKEHSLEGNVRFLGFKKYSEFLQELYNHHIFLSPSITAVNGDAEGGAPVSIIEASASGMPVISTLHCDIPEIILNGKSGYLVPEQDIESLKDKLNYLIHNHNEWVKMGLEGRRHIEKYYNIVNNVKKIKELYDQF